jgi:hypothetical protein
MIHAMDPEELDTLVQNSKDSVERTRELTEETVRLLQESREARERFAETDAEFKEVLESRGSRTPPAEEPKP